MDIFSGLYNYQPELIFAGTIPVTIIALVVDFLLSKLERIMTPKAFILQQDMADKQQAREDAERRAR